MPKSRCFGIKSLNRIDLGTKKLAKVTKTENNNSSDPTCSTKRRSLDESFQKEKHSRLPTQNYCNVLLIHQVCIWETFLKNLKYKIQKPEVKRKILQLELNSI